TSRTRGSSTPVKCMSPARPMALSLKLDLDHANLNVLTVADRRFPHSRICVAMDPKRKGGAPVGLDREIRLKRACDARIAEELQVWILMGNAAFDVIAANLDGTLVAFQNDLQRRQCNIRSAWLRRRGGRRVRTARRSA